MENFFYEDKFYSDIEELMIDLEIDEESIQSMPDFYKCYKSSFEPVLKLDADWILDRIDDERKTEDGNELDEIEQLLNQIDFSKFNEQCPKLYYPTWEKFEITKADLYAAL